MELEDTPRRDTLTDRMRAAREKDVVSLQSYNTARSKHPSIAMIVLEGDEDPIYYGTMIGKTNPDLTWVPLVCKGKDRVLSLRVLLERNKDIDASLTYFIVDHDFDHLKGHQPGPNLYCTPSYSIENLLISDEVLNALLLGEYKCGAGDESIGTIRGLFEDRLAEFVVAMELANRTLHFCRTKKLYSGSVENRIKQYLSISLDAVSSKYDETDVGKLVGFSDELDISAIGETTEAFDRLDPMKDWRGKFVLSTFVELLSLLQEDGNMKVPKYFQERRKVSFNPKSSTIRVLASIAPAPTCLRDFIDRIAA